jgi:hypothetical protein
MMQFFILTPFFMYVHKYFRRFSYIVIVLLIVSNLCIVYSIVVEYDIQAYMFFDNNY